MTLQQHWKSRELSKVESDKLDAPPLPPSELQGDVTSKTHQWGKSNGADNGSLYLDDKFQKPQLGSGYPSQELDLIRWDRQRQIAEELTSDIVDMASSLYRLAQIRRPWQEAATENVRSVVISIWPHALVDIYGSFGTGLSLPSSDIDLVITGVGAITHLPSRWGAGAGLSSIVVLKQHLQQASWVSTIQSIDNTAMPLIKLTTAPVPMPHTTGNTRGIIKIDISFAAVEQGSAPPSFGHHVGPAATGQQFAAKMPNGLPSSISNNHLNFAPINFLTPSNSSTNIPSQHTLETSTLTHQGVSTRDFLLRLCAINPVLIPLVIVMKQFLLQKGLNDPFTGGLSSYAVTIMIAAILQPYALETPETHPDLGTLFLTFLKYFGTSFDTRKYAVVLSINGPFVPLSPGLVNNAHLPRVGTPGYWKPPDPVIVQDPLNSSNNLGRSCFGFRQLQMAFDGALESAMQFDGEINNTCGANATKKKRSVLGSIFGTEHHDAVVKLSAQMWCPLNCYDSHLPITCDQFPLFRYEKVHSDLII